MTQDASLTPENRQRLVADVAQLLSDTFRANATVDDSWIPEEFEFVDTRSTFDEVRETYQVDLAFHHQTLNRAVVVSIGETALAEMLRDPEYGLGAYGDHTGIASLLNINVMEELFAIREDPPPQVWM